MNTEVANMPSQADIDALAALAGASQDRGPRLAALKTNVNGEDENGELYPAHTFYITEQEQMVFAKTVKFRPLVQHYQYSEYDPTENVMLCKSINFTSFRKDGEEPVDTCGTIKCGRPTSAELKEMPDATRKKYENKSVARNVRGLVSYTGTTASGEEVTVENVPVILRLKGSNFMPFATEFFDKLPNGKKIWDYWAELSIERMRNGSVVYHVIHFAPDFSKPAVLDPDTLESVKVFIGMVESENRDVRKKYREALLQNGGLTEAETAGSESLEADMED